MKIEKMTLTDVAKVSSLEEVRNLTEAKFEVAADLKSF